MPLLSGKVKHNRVSISTYFSSLPTQAAPRKNVKNDNDLKTSPRQAAWKISPLKAENRKRELLWRTYLFILILAVSLFFPVRPGALFSNFVTIWRLVVFRNICQRFDSISGMLSMTLVWNQRTTLENEGGGERKTFQGGAIGARQSTGSWGRDSVPGRAYKSLNTGASGPETCLTEHTQFCSSQ